jgi:hypothetical protein
VQIDPNSATSTCPKLTAKRTDKPDVFFHRFSDSVFFGPFSTEQCLNSQSDADASHCISGKTVLKQEDGDYCVGALQCHNASPLTHSFRRKKVKISNIKFYTEMLGVHTIPTYDGSLYLKNKLYL